MLVLVRGLVVVTTTLALLLVVSAPASATTYPVEVVWGSLVGGFPTLPMADAGSQGEPPCEAKPSTVEATFDGDAVSGTFALGGEWSVQFQLPPGSGSWFQLDYRIFNLTPPLSQGAYRWDNPPPFPPAPPPYLYSLATLGAPFVLQVRIYAVPSCDKTDLRCTITGVFAMTGIVTSPTQLPTYSPGDIVLNGSSLYPMQVSGPCAPPWVVWSGTTGTLMGVTLA